jgi:hypothetical protein
MKPNTDPPKAPELTGSRPLAGGGIGVTDHAK